MTGWWLAVSQVGLGAEAGGWEGLAANCSLPTSPCPAHCLLPTSMPEPMGSPSVSRDREKGWGSSAGWREGGEQTERGRERGAQQKEGAAEEKGQKLSAHQVPDPGSCIPLPGTASALEAGLWLSFPQFSASPQEKGEKSCDGFGGD